MIFANVKDWTITEGAVKQVTDSLGRVIWQKQTPPTPANDYFYVEDVSGNYNTLSIRNTTSDAYNIEVFKSTDQTNWESMGTTSYNTQLTATVPANSKLYLKATTDRWGRSRYDYTGITVNGDYNVGGNILSLLFGDNFQNASFTGSNFSAFISLFRSSLTLVNAGNLALPSNTENSCYRSMFSGCTSLTTPPVLPATTLTDYCYCDMFSTCSSLTTPPALPATTLADYCYAGMFEYCSLTTAPALPATTLTNWCYAGMFEYCSRLTIAPTLPATTLTQSCYYEMFWYCTNLSTVTTYANDISASGCLTDWLEGVAATGDFYNEGSATYPVNSASGIPTGWTEHKTITNEYFYVEDVSGSPNTLSIVGKTGAPTINVYYSTDQTTWESMGITSTTPITATIPANGKLYLKANTTGWCNSSSQSKYNNIQTTGNCNIGGYINSLLYGDSFDMYDDLNGTENYKFGSLFRENTNLISAARLVTPHTLATGCYSNMFNGCTGLTTAPALPATTLANNCYQQMFYGCTSLTTAPVLQATTLAASCYNGMFKNCTALTTAPVLPATTLLRSSYASLFNGCSSLNSVTSYAQDISATTCTIIWLNGVSATGDFYNLGGATYASGDPSGIPSGWTEHNTL